MVARQKRRSPQSREKPRWWQRSSCHSCPWKLKPVLHYWLPWNRFRSLFETEQESPNACEKLHLRNNCDLTVSREILPWLPCKSCKVPQSHRVDNLDKRQPVGYRNCWLNILIPQSWHLSVFLYIHTSKHAYTYTYAFAYAYSSTHIHMHIDNNYSRGFVKWEIPTPWVSIQTWSNDSDDLGSPHFRKPAIASKFDSHLSGWLTRCQGGWR